MAARLTRLFNLVTMLLVFSTCFNTGGTVEVDTEGTVEASTDSEEFVERYLKIAGNDMFPGRKLNAQQMADSMAIVYCECLESHDIEAAFESHKSQIQSYYSEGRIDLQAKRNFTASGGYDATLFLECGDLTYEGIARGVKWRTLTSDQAWQAVNKQCGDLSFRYREYKKTIDSLDRQAVLDLDFYVSEEDRETFDGDMMLAQTWERTKAEAEKKELQKAMSAKSLPSGEQVLTSMMVNVGEVQMLVAGAQPLKGQALVNRMAEISCDCMTRYDLDALYENYIKKQDEAINRGKSNETYMKSNMSGSQYQLQSYVKACLMMSTFYPNSDAAFSDQDLNAALRTGCMKEYRRSLQILEGIVYRDENSFSLELPDALDKQIVSRATAAAQTELKKKYE